MLKSAERILDAGAASGRDSPKPEEILRQLRAILASPAFHGSKRCQQFLEYVVQKSLSDGPAALKERTVAVEVFGRRPESDLGEDTIVRVGAREVRKRLAQFYVTPEGVASEIRIDLPPGAYVPEFRYPAPPHEEPAPLKPVIQPVVPPVGALRRHPVLWALAVVGVAGAIAAGAVAKWTGMNPNTEAFLRFWEPVLRAHEPLLIAVAHPIVYHASSRAFRLSEGIASPADQPTQRPIQVAANKLDGSDLVPVFNQYVGFGDMMAATNVSAMLARRSKDVRVRMASSVQFADLRQAPALLIGAVTNRWTMELQQSWRFQFHRTSELKIVIADTLEPSGAKPPVTPNRQQWSIPARADGSSPEDFLVICRVRNSYTGGLVMAAAGLKQFGTEAAGALLIDPEHLGAILRKLPSGWEGKNLQVVLHARVIGNTPAQPEVVAWHVW